MKYEFIFSRENTRKTNINDYYCVGENIINSKLQQKIVVARGFEHFHNVRDGKFSATLWKWRLNTWTNSSVGRTINLDSHGYVLKLHLVQRNFSTSVTYQKSSISLQASTKRVTTGSYNPTTPGFCTMGMGKAVIYP